MPSAFSISGMPIASALASCADIQVFSRLRSCASVSMVASLSEAHLFSLAWYTATSIPGMLSVCSKSAPWVCIQLPRGSASGSESS
eukprot:4313507-Prymnesium_polylepis.4